MNKFKVEVKQVPHANFGGSKTTEVKMLLTDGELLALQNLLRNHDTAVGSDLCAMFANALKRAGIELE